MRLPSQIDGKRRDESESTGAIGVGAAACSLAVRGMLSLLAAAALGFSVYLGWVSLNGGTVAGCDPGGAFDCDRVLSTKWSTWLGVPVALPAAMLYGSVLAAVWFLGASVPAAVRRAAWTIVLALTATAGLSAAWFIGLQTLVIGSLCWPCLATHASGLLLAAAAWAAAWFASRRVGYSPLRAAAVAVGIAVVAVGVLVGGQSAYESPTFRIDRGDGPPMAAADSATPATGSSGGEPAAATADEPTPRTVQKPPLSRILRLHKTTTTLDAYEHPIVGSPDAEHVLVKLFDYSCHHCREQHLQLEEARKHFGDRLAIVVLPVPMNRHCNPYATGTATGPHAQACAYARLAIAVWQTDRTKFAEFHHWLFAPAEPRPLEEVRERVREIVGQAGVDRADNSLEPRRALETYTDLYDALGRGKIPKLVDERFVIDGRFRDGRQIVEVLEEEWKSGK